MARSVSLLLVALAVGSLLVTVRSDDEVVGEGGGGGGGEGPATGGKPVFKPPTRPSKGEVFFEESFSDLSAAKKRWIKSKAKKEGADADIAQYDGMGSCQISDSIMLS